MRRLLLIVSVLLGSFGCDATSTETVTVDGVPAETDVSTPSAPAPAVSEADAVQPSEPIFAVDTTGLLVAPHRFFKAAAALPTLKVEMETIADRAFVTPDGVFAFVDSAENQQQLASMAIGTAVHIRGTAHRPSRLLHIAHIEARPDADVVFDDAAVAASPGNSITVTGSNQCACGMKIPEVHTSCKLGHLHHLVAEDGRIYHYLQFAQGKDAYLGRGLHFKKVTVEAVELPGQFLLVRDVTVH